MSKYYAGQELDARCGRCKDETRHRILSITDGVPEKLMCAVCGSSHKFRQEKPKAAASAPASRPGRMATAAAPRPAAASPGRSQELMSAEQGGARALPYSPATAWLEGQWMDHPSFGLGRVQRKASRKVEVLFRDGLKTLISA